MNKKYDWKRYWCLRGGQRNLSDGGFLSDPESEFSHYYPQDVNALEEIIQEPCLVLLGEPGIGKTNELKKSIVSHKKIIGLNNEQIFYKELNQYSDENRFIKDVFNNEDFLKAKQNNLPYFLLLDSLDECKIRIDTISEVLAYKLKENYWSNLYLRITCRTAEWSNYLENSIVETFGEKEVKLFELAPLRKEDVILALKENEIEEEKFFEEIYLKDVQPLAIKPITLNFIINLYKTNKTLPSSRREIFEEGLKLLINEHNISRKESKLTKKYSDSHKLVVAQRLATTMMLSNKTNVTFQSNEVKEDTDLIIEDIYGKEVFNKEEIIITEDLVRETLNTGLFVSNDKERFKWFHQTFTEYLTARYLWEKEISEKQIFNLLFKNYNGKIKSVPQLNEIIGWLVSFRPELFDQILKDDTEVLFSSDVALQDDKDKKNFVNQLLKLFEENGIYDVNYSFLKNYHKLKHENIENQLRTIINDKTKNDETRYQAIDIAESCKLDGLLNDISVIFQDKSEAIFVRKNAGHAINNIGNEIYIKKMKSVLLDDLSDDIDDELKGICLIALWPSYLTYTELFSVLQKRKRKNFGGNYMMFLYDFKLLNPTSEDLTIALKWVSQQDSKHNLDLQGITEIIDQIMFTAFKYLDNKNVLEEYKNAVIHITKNYDEVVGNKLQDSFYKMYEEEDEKRRKFIKSIIHTLSIDEKKIGYLFRPDKSLVIKKDFLWVLEQTISKNPVNIKKRWLSIVWMCFDITNINHINHLLLMSTKHKSIENEFKYYLKTVDLYSDEANSEKEKYLKYYKPKNWESKRTLYKLNYVENKNDLFRQLKSGDNEILWQIIRFLSSDPENKAHFNEYASEIIQYPGWQILTKDEKNLIIVNSKKYLFSQNPQNDSWFGTGTYFRPAAAGYKIVKMLLSLDEKYLDNLSTELYKKWAPIVVDYPISYGLDNGDNYEDIVKLFYEKAPKEILGLLKKKIDLETVKDERVWITYKFEKCRDDEISNILYEKLIEEKLYANCYKSLLEDLLKRNFKPAIKHALKQVSLPLPNDELEYKKLLFGTSLLINYFIREAWVKVAKIIQKEYEFGKELFLSIAYERSQNKNFLKFMSSEDLSDLFIWLEEKFPRKEHKETEEAHFVGRREEIEYFKDNIIEELKQKGDNETELEIKKIQKKFPKLDWLNYVLYQAKIVTRQKSWNPLNPKELLKLLDNENLRSINNENELVNVILESLEKLEVRMHGITPSVEFVWNEKPLIPKAESHLSNFIKTHLQEDLSNTIINREVEIRPTMGSSSGENTDILVQTFSGNKKNIISVIIEVKGSWNKGLKKDMEDQLKNRYLKDNQCKYGIYLVGWFLCDSWDKTKDYRYKENPKMEIETAKTFFQDQSNKLSDDNIHIYSKLLDCRLN